MLAVLLTVSVWVLWQQSHAKPRTIAAQLNQVRTGASQSSPIPINAGRMVPVVGLAESSSLVTPYSGQDNWTAVNLIVDERADFEHRLLASDVLAKHLSEADWDELRKFLLMPAPLDQSPYGQTVKNRLMDALCAMNPLPDGLGEVLSKIYHDPHQDGVIRDYAVQHLTPYYEQLATQPDSNQELAAAKAVLWEAIKEPGGSVQGTALLALKRLSQEFTDFNQAEITTTATQLASDPTTGELTHITALQVCAQLGVDNALPVALQAAQAGETIPVKISAIGALGQLGGTEQIPFLQGVVQGTDDRLKPAAQHSLEQIAARQNQNNGRKQTL